MDLGDHPVATEALTALHLSVYDIASPKALHSPNGLVHCRVRWVFDFGWWLYAVTDFESWAFVFSRRI